MREIGSVFLGLALWRRLGQTSPPCSPWASSAAEPPSWASPSRGTRARPWRTWPASLPTRSTTTTCTGREQADPHTGRGRPRARAKAGFIQKRWLGMRSPTPSGRTESSGPCCRPRALKCRHTCRRRVRQVRGTPSLPSCRANHDLTPDHESGSCPFGGSAHKCGNFPCHEAQRHGPRCVTQRASRKKMEAKYRRVMGGNRRRPRLSRNDSVGREVMAKQMLAQAEE